MEKDNYDKYKKDIVDGVCFVHNFPLPHNNSIWRR
jgi:hypothetical protein